ncbi:MAG: hypothetical protein IPM82_14655 [Saprospiraceae bacterium]|nr:hypothetical protein [Saprospiraceae bacterium]
MAEEYLVGDAAVYGAGTFYDFTRPENKGKKCTSATAVPASWLVRRKG